MALAACTQADVPDSQRKPELVSLGMSVRQVDALMGHSTETCWRYQHNNEPNGVCFHGGKVVVFSLGQGIEPDMAPAQVKPLIGEVRNVLEVYQAGGRIYNALFVHGRLTEFGPLPYPPVIN